MSIDRLPPAPAVGPRPRSLAEVLDGRRAHLSVLCGPGVYPSQRDTWLLADVLRRELLDSPVPPRRVLELCSGAGALSLVAARCPGDATSRRWTVSRRALRAPGSTPTAGTTRPRAAW